MYDEMTEDNFKDKDGKLIVYIADFIGYLVLVGYPAE